jgi:hypothetical protein
MVFFIGGGDALPSEAVPSLHCGTTREDPAASIPGHVQVQCFTGIRCIFNYRRIFCSVSDPDSLIPDPHQHFRLITNPDLDPLGFDDQKF